MALPVTTLSDVLTSNRSVRIAVNHSVGLSRSLRIDIPVLLRRSLEGLCWFDSRSLPRVGRGTPDGVACGDRREPHLF